MAAVCDVCGLPAMATFVCDLLVTETLLTGASCPQHVDTIIGRLQDNLHDTMSLQEGVLLDWWTPIINPPELEETTT